MAEQNIASLEFVISLATGLHTTNTLVFADQVAGHSTNTLSPETLTLLATLLGSGWTATFDETTNVIHLRKVRT
jgi:hypothetical protein